MPMFGITITYSKSMPLTGKVLKISIAQPSSKGPKASDDEVLNGIAYDPKAGTFYITGKNGSTCLRYDGNWQLATGNW